MSLQTTPFDAADYLETPDEQVAFLADAFESGNAAHIREALNTVARARGMSDLARETGVSREGLYKALGESGDPKLSTLLSVLAALNMRLTMRPADGEPCALIEDAPDLSAPEWKEKLDAAPVRRGCDKGRLQTS